VDYIRAWGIENIVFASDWSFSSPVNYINNIKRLLPLSESEVERILSNDTSIRMFG
jgi:predicted TIM-barrel fold metal-dependent hydrolase